MDTISSKRQRTDQLHLLELDDSLLMEVCSYLAEGNRALLAVALTAPSSAWTDYDQCSQSLSSATKLVLSMHNDNWQSDWEKLDFNHMQIGATPRKVSFLRMETDVRKLDDSVLNAVLTCIDARNNVKSLRIPHCYSIVGHGLEPLRGSTVLQQVDFSLVGYYSTPKLHEEVAISEDAVLKILRSIIGQEGNSLQHIQLPKSWREEKSPELTSFLQQYNNALDEKYNTNAADDAPSKICCRGTCNNIAEPEMDSSGYSRRYGVQSGTCNECMKQFCYHPPFPCHDYCRECEKYYCNDCSFVMPCMKCYQTSCIGCAKIQSCNNCFKTSCFTCADVICCLECFKTSCFDCTEIMHCMSCFRSLCMSDCGLSFKLCCNQFICDECECCGAGDSEASASPGSS